MMSMESWMRPSLRASLKVSCNCPAVTPSTGMSRRIDASADDCSPGGASACGDAPGEAAGLGLGVGDGEASGVGLAVAAGVGAGVGRRSTSLEGGGSGVAGCDQY